MMKYYLFQLKFTSPVHFGDTSNGGGLEKSGMHMCADTFFSALCCEMADMQEFNLMQEFVSSIRERKMLLSDLLPYKMDSKGNTFLYLPRPIQSSSIISKGETLSDMRRLSAYNKKLKKLEYIRASKLMDYCAASSNNQSYEIDDVVFGNSTIVERVNCRGDEPLPYYVKQFTFDKKAGLYGILGADDDSTVDFVQKLLVSLGYSGIGGKRSSGYGHFELLDDILPLSEADYYVDAVVIAKMLADEKASHQMNISILYPEKKDFSIVQEGSYRIKKRSGFTDNVKRNSIYMIEAGSCFKERIDGSLIDISDTRSKHPIYRYGLGLYVGLSL